MILTSDGTTYERETTGCEGSDATTLAYGECSVLKTNLLGAPFNLLWGTELFVKVIATSAVGDSLESNIASGTYLLRSPDTPINFQNNAA